MPVRNESKRNSRHTHLSAYQPNHQAMTETKRQTKQQRYGWKGVEWQLQNGNASMLDIHLGRLLWLHHPGHAAVEENDRADIVARKTTITSGLRLGKSECWGARDTLLAGAKPRTLYHRSLEGEKRRKRKAFEDLPSKNEKKPSSIRSTLELFQRATPGKQLRSGLERIWAFPSGRYQLELSWTELTHAANQPGGFPVKEATVNPTGERVPWKTGPGLDVTVMTCWVVVVDTWGKSMQHGRFSLTF